MFIRTTPPAQDEANAMLKKLYVCHCRGCGWPSERKAIYCKDHATAEQRAECEAEHDKRSAMTTA
jgi:hypothetical protein